MKEKNEKCEKISRRKKDSDEMIKWRKVGAIVGGIWGLICGVWYGWNSLVMGFAGISGEIFDSFLEIIIFFPTLVTDSIINYLFKINEILIILAVPIFTLALWFFIVWSIKISRKICIGGGLLLLILTIYSRFPLGFLSIVMWFAVIPFLLSVVFGILIASILCYFLSSSSMHESLKGQKPHN